MNNTKVPLIQVLSLSLSPLEAVEICEKNKSFISDVWGENDITDIQVTMRIPLKIAFSCNFWAIQLTYELVPAFSQFRVVSQTSLHDVDAIVLTGPDLRDPLTGGTRRHLGQGDDALVLGIDLEEKQE